ncbi:carbohydrate porin [filamentous cyanobacterium LEGE 11480]|uniref:Carbohydrate porin n=1 Tax=Romeriopsis navalis LEGE 11480 TaxID=2777977 RepID=A0A928VW23_9CYAN|nr:iron uptake porin [Romeriopsis navalis]MBE9033239.1 carbohydrate porin [Romeriopsis navalis LEGE 11480]
MNSSEMGVRIKMVKVLNSLLAASVASAAVLVAGAAQANEPTSVSSLEQLSQYSQEGQNNATASVTSVSQLSDVRPTDWAFQALQSLVERYGCIAGYPDKTYRGNRAMTRYEFAAGLNACMDRVNELIAAATNDMASKQDLATLQKLQEDFAAELATLRGRVDAVEAKVATLEKQQFSTTTKLSGEVVFGISDEFGTNNDNETVFQDRVRLTLNTSFTGKDLLITRLAAGNGNNFNLNGEEPLGTQASINFGNTGGNNVAVDWLAYYADLGDKVTGYVAAFGGLLYDFAPTVSAMDTGDDGNGTISFFGQRNPIYTMGGGSGAGLTYELGGGLKVSGGYFAANAANPASGNGLFQGDNSILGQITYQPENSPFALAATYVSGYNETGALFGAGGGGGFTGTSFSNNLNAAFAGPTKVNAYGVSGTMNISKNIAVSAFGLYANADEIGDGLGSNDVWSYGGSVGFKDFGKKGNLLGFVVGAQPYAPGARQGAGGVQIGRAGTVAPLHVEGFYKYQLNDKISITPGVIWVKDPGQAETDDILIGTLRTTFSF